MRVRLYQSHRLGSCPCEDPTLGAKFANPVVLLDVRHWAGPIDTSDDRPQDR